MTPALDLLTPSRRNRLANTLSDLIYQALKRRDSEELRTLLKIYGRLWAEA